MKRIRLSIIHVAVIAAISTVAPVEAKNILEGQNIELKESVYEADVIGGQYIKDYQPYSGTYFSPSKNPLYGELKDLDSTSIYLGKNQQITEELIGGTYLHGGTTAHEAETKFCIGSVNIDVGGALLDKISLVEINLIRMQPRLLTLQLMK